MPEYVLGRFVPIENGCGQNQTTVHEVDPLVRRSEVQGLIKDALLEYVNTHVTQPMLIYPPKPQFPAHLRRMWSGGEVQKWIDEYWPKA